jgi:hypothetical protein
MITVTGFKQKTTKDGRDLTLLELTGDLALVQSSTGKWYATTPKCSMPSTLDEKTAQMMIGTKMDGRIARVATDPYSFVDQTTGEEITLVFRWGYIPAGAMEPLEVNVS